MIGILAGLVSVLATGALWSFPAIAADAAPATQCFEVVNAPPGFTSFSFLLENKCTGSTWALQKVPSLDAKGNPNGIVFRWRQLNFDNTQGDALFPQ